MASIVDFITYNCNELYVSLLLIICGALLWIFHQKQRSSVKYILGNKIPGPTPLPIFGNILLLIGKRTENLVNIALNYGEQYGDVVRGWIGYKLVVFLSDAKDIEVILNSQVHIDKSEEYTFFKPWLGDGLLISTGEKWRSHRKMIAPTFHLNILKSFIDIFNHRSKIVVNRMQCELGNTFDVHEYMGGVTVDILLETVMGITKEKQDESGFDYAMAVMKMCDIIHQRHYKVWLRFDVIFKWTKLFKKQFEFLKIIHGLTEKVIKIKKAKSLENKFKGILPITIEELTKTSDMYDNVSSKTVCDNILESHSDDLEFDDDSVGEKKRLAFLDLMIESAQDETNRISDQEIKEEVDTIMFEGHDTTAAGSSFVLCLLGIYHNIQDRVYNELYEIFGDSDRPASFNDTVHMKYLERVILETLRLYPPVPVIARKLKTDTPIVTNNYILPEGTNVVISIYKVHRSPQHYENPDTFDPDNFLPENTQERYYYSFIPFSAGPRSCVGRKYALMKLKILLSTILRNYKIVSEVTEEKFKLQADIILKRTDGFTINIEKRIRRPVT